MQLRPVGKIFSCGPSIGLQKRQMLSCTRPTRRIFSCTRPTRLLPGASILQWLRVYMQMFRIAINKLFEWLFSGVIAKGRFPVWTCLSWDLQFRMKMTLVKSLHCGDPDVICPVRQKTCGLASAAGRCFADALQVLFGQYILVQIMCVHCSCMLM